MASGMRVFPKTYGGGPLRSRLEANREFFEMFNDADRNKIMRRAAFRATFTWRRKNLWKRVNARTVKAPPFNYRLGGNTPMIGMRKKSDPAKLINAIQRGKIRVSTKGSTRGENGQKIMAVVPFPFGHAVHREQVVVFQTVPPNEVQSWADDIINYAFTIAGKAQLKIPKRRDAKPRLVLSSAQRRALSPTPRAKR